mgnify:CR=1 FL=1
MKRHIDDLNEERTIIIEKSAKLKETNAKLTNENWQQKEIYWLALDKSTKESLRMETFEKDLESMKSLKNKYELKIQQIHHTYEQ